MGHGAWPSIAPALSVWVHTGAMGSLCFAGPKEGTASQRGPSGLSKSRWWSWGRQAQGTVPHREASGALASPYLMTAPTLGCPPRAEPPRHLPTSCSRAEVPRPSFCLTRRSRSASPGFVGPSSTAAWPALALRTQRTPPDTSLGQSNLVATHPSPRDLLALHDPAVWPQHHIRSVPRQPQAPTPPLLSTGLAHPDCPSPIGAQ